MRLTFLGNQISIVVAKGHFCHCLVLLLYQKIPATISMVTINRGAALQPSEIHFHAAELTQ
jgi:hypothetical protein